MITSKAFVGTPCPLNIKKISISEILDWSFEFKQRPPQIGINS